MEQLQERRVLATEIDESAERLEAVLEQSPDLMEHAVAYLSGDEPQHVFERNYKDLVMTGRLVD